MDYDRIIEDMEDIQKVFYSFGVKLILVYGALLGHYRDGDFLPGDDDVDFAVVDKISYEKRKKIGRTLLNLGFKPQPVMFNVFGEMELSEPGYNGDGDSGIIVCERNFKFTIFFFGLMDCETHGFEYVCIPKLGAMKLISTPIKFFESRLDRVKVGRNYYLTPWPIELYLRETYFNNWADKEDRRHGLLYSEQHPTT